MVQALHDLGRPKLHEPERPLDACVAKGVEVVARVCNEHAHGERHTLEQALGPMPGLLAPLSAAKGCEGLLAASC